MASPVTETVAPAYEHRLKQEKRWALDEGGLHFEGKSLVQISLRKVTRRLDELGIPYAVVGGMALYAHGYERFTSDVDILVTRESLKLIHEKLDGLGYLPPFTGSKHLRDAEHGVRIEFLVSGGYPGDGKPKPVAFPDPVGVTTEVEGIRYLTLPKLLELKLASGMTDSGRFKDLGDVQELIKAIALPRSFAEELDPYVRPRYTELWDGVQASLGGPNSDDWRDEPDSPR